MASDSGLGRFLTLADTAQVLNVPVADVRQLVASGQLPAIRVGETGRWRVERSVLESYIEAMYEVSRRSSLWQQSDFGNIPELSGGTILPRGASSGTDDQTRTSTIEVSGTIR